MSMPALAYTWPSRDQVAPYCEETANFYNSLYMYVQYRYDCVDLGITQTDFDGAPLAQINMYETEIESNKKWILRVWFYSTPSKPSLTIAAQPPKIPSYSGVTNGRVLTVSPLILSFKKDGKGEKAQITLTSNRGPLTDSFLQGGVISTDQAGNATTPVFTRLQSGTSTITANATGAGIIASTSVSWLPAKYNESFVVTCYTIANEKDWSTTPSSSNVCGLPEDNSYSSRFLQDVRMQGSGVTRDGTIIHYNSNQACYNTESCARTATGVCAVPGTTIAVDTTVIPRKSTVKVDILGQRQAQDTGGGIKGYHIDDYVGEQPALCRQLGRRNSGISLSNY